MIGGIHEEHHTAPSRLGMKTVSREADGTVHETETNVTITETIMRAAHGSATDRAPAMAGYHVEGTCHDLNPCGQMAAIMLSYADLLDSMATRVNQDDATIDATYGRLVDTYHSLLDDYVNVCHFTGTRVQTIKHTNVWTDTTPQVECAHRTWTSWRSFTRHAIHDKPETNEDGKANNEL